MPLIAQLPPELENVEHLIARRTRAATIKEMWRSLYRECFWYAMPTRETFTWHTEGQYKNRFLYDSTLQEATASAANTLTALLFPAWQRWAELAPGGAIDPNEVSAKVADELQKATKQFFTFLNISNFSTVIGESALDLMVGTCSLSFDEGDAEMPFIFSSIPLSVIEIEEGPMGSVESTFMRRTPKARNIDRMYPGINVFDLSGITQAALLENPETEVPIIQCEVYYPKTKRYYGIVLEEAAKQIVWRYDYEDSCPTIVARASKVAGETYGRGRVMLALSDAKTLDKMQEFVLKHSALQIAPPLTGVTDGVLNPYTASLTPNTIIPVMSNDNGNPSLKVLEMGGNFQIGSELMNDLRQRVRRTMLGPEPSEGAVKSATEINISDRNRLWAMNGEYTRIQSELLAKIIQRGVFILQKKGLMAKIKINGQQVAVKYTSPFAQSQNAEDILAVQKTLATAGQLGPEMLHLGLKTEDIPGYVARLNGMPEKLIRDETEKKTLMDKVQAASAQANMQQAQAGATAAPSAPPPGPMLP